MPVVCDGCGCRFARSAGALTQYTKLHGRTQHFVFHDRACLLQHAKRLGLFNIRYHKGPVATQSVTTR